MPRKTLEVTACLTIIAGSSSAFKNDMTRVEIILNDSPRGLLKKNQSDSCTRPVIVWVISSRVAPSQAPKLISSKGGSFTWVSIQGAARFAVVKVLPKGLTNTMRGRHLTDRNTSPWAMACRRPLSVRGEFFWPWKRPCWFQSISPCLKI